MHRTTDHTIGVTRVELRAHLSDKSFASDPTPDTMARLGVGSFANILQIVCQELPGESAAESYRLLVVPVYGQSRGTMQRAALLY